jgi:hypothetical protein
VLTALEGRSSLLNEEICELLRSHEVSSDVKRCLKFAVTRCFKCKTVNYDVEYTLQSIVFDFRGSPSKEGTKKLMNEENSF